MNSNSLLKIVLIAALVAIVVGVILKLLGYENSTTIGGGAAGGVAGALVAYMLNKQWEKRHCFRLTFLMFIRPDMFVYYSFGY